MRCQAVQPERIELLNKREPRRGKYVLYWMQQSQRAEFNHALEYAIARANEANRPVLVAFGLTDDYPEANLRHYRFLLEGLQETQERLYARGIRMVVQLGPPDEIALRLSREAALVVCDRGYLRHQKAWRERVAKAAGCQVVQVESDVVVPVATASSRAEVAARTFRPKIRRLREMFLVPLSRQAVRKDSLDIRVEGVSLADLDALLAKLHVDRSVPPANRWFRGGTREARRRLRLFLRSAYRDYAAARGQPQIDLDNASHLSMYLHFGQISPVEIALAARRAKVPAESEEAFLEELIVRRELAHNFVHFTPDYDRFACLPRWAKESLRAHGCDPRTFHYSRAELESAATHDPYWNAAMREMVHTGYLHNYLRMYWGKKILEWSRTPEQAFHTALALNNKYFLDGRDPNSFANVAWIFGLHDRPFAERPVFGKIRFMSAGGLKRKCAIEDYVAQVRSL